MGVITKIALRNMKRRKTRYILTTATLVIGVALFGGILIASDSFYAMMLNSMDQQMGTADVLIRTADTENGWFDPDEIDDSLVSKSDRDTFVQRVEECLRIRCQSNSSVAGGKLMLNRARVMLAHMSKRSTSYDQLYLLENSYVTRNSATPTTVIPRKDSSFSHLVKDERIHAAENQQAAKLAIVENGIG